MGLFLRGFETRKSIIAINLSTRSFTKIGTKYTGKRWLTEWKSLGSNLGQHESVRRETELREETEIDEWEEENETTNNRTQPPKQPYWKRYEIKNKHRDVKTFFKTPEWMKPAWSTAERLRGWWVGKHATEKSQSQEAYGDIYPLEIPSPTKQDNLSEVSDMEGLVRRVGVGLPINLALRRTLLKEAKMDVGLKHMLNALQRRDPHELLRVLVQLERADPGRANSSPLLDIPSNTFSEILRLLDPKHFFGRYKRLLQNFHHRDLLEMRIDTVDYDGTHRAYTVYLHYLHRMIMKRWQRHPTYLSDYKMLLKAARFTGNQTVADLTWKSLCSNRFQVMPGRRILPDVECFNYYMATMCWSDILSPFHSDKLRVVSHLKEQRQWEDRPHRLNRHRVGPDYGIKISVSRLFRQMSEMGLVGNEETFCLLMISASREEDLAMVEAIVKRVWNIDVNQQNDNDPRLNKLLLDSPLHPSKRLIRTIVHIYAINNDLPTALRVIDQVSRKYSIDIPIEAWEDILQWTAIFARKKGSALHRERGFDQGILPPAGMNDVWLMMTSEPYYVKPTLTMYNVYIRHLLSRRQIGEAQLQIGEAYRLQTELARREQHYRVLYENSLRRRKPDSALTRIRERNFVFHRLRLRTSRMYMRRWINFLIYRPSKYLTTYHQNWAFQNIPMIVKTYKSLLRGEITYQTYTGHVRLQTGTQKETKLRIWRRRYGNMQSRRRRLRVSLGKYLKRKRIRLDLQRKAGGRMDKHAPDVVWNHPQNV